MKRQIMVWLLILAAIGLMGCGKEKAAGSEPGNTAGQGSAAAGEAAGDGEKAGKGVGEQKNSGLLTRLSDGSSWCSGENGYYYITENAREGADGTMLRQLLYVDYASG